MSGLPGLVANYADQLLADAKEEIRTLREENEKLHKGYLKRNEECVDLAARCQELEEELANRSQELHLAEL